MFFFFSFCQIQPSIKLKPEKNVLTAIFFSLCIFHVKEIPQMDAEEISIDKISEVDDSKCNEINMKFSSYLAEGNDSKVRKPVYCKELGFAMEKIKDGFTLKDLWEVIPS